MACGASGIFWVSLFLVIVANIVIGVIWGQKKKCYITACFGEAAWQLSFLHFLLFSLNYYYCSRSSHPG